MKIIGFLFKSLFWLTLLAGFGAVLLLLAGLEQSPLVTQGQQLARSDIDRAKLLLRQHDPRRQQPGRIRTLRFSERELNLLANYLLASFGNGAARVSLSDGEVRIDATLRLPQNPLGNYLNLHLGVSESNGHAVISALRLGSVTVPQPVAQRLPALLANSLLSAEAFDNARDSLKAIKLGPQRLALTYQWDPQLVDQVRERLLTNEERQQLVTAWGQLAAALKPVTQRKLALHDLLERLFRQMDRGDVADPVAANRAVIMVLAVYINGRSLLPLLGDDQSLPRIRRVWVKLRGRGDLAKHFIVSAALNVSGGGVLSQLLGLHKELSDAQGGSGFSFADLAADLAGNRFAEVLTGSQALARRSRGILANGLAEDAIMPSIHGLQEGLQERSFKQRYGSTESRAYQKEVDRIQRRINRCALYGV